MIRDFFDIIFSCIAFLSKSEFIVAIIVAFVLGVLCWVACSYYTKLWHKRFHVRAQHHLLCAIAAIFTVIFTIQYRAVGDLEYIVDYLIDDWHDYISDDNDFAFETYELAFYTLKDEYPAAFRGVAEPGRSESRIPFANDDMIVLCVEIYVDEARDNFSTHHPFLNLMLKARPGISQQEIEEDIDEFFRRNPGESYPLNRAIDIAAEHIQENLLLQSPKTVWKTRLILVLLFLIVQLIPFGTIGYLANKDLRNKHLKV